MRILHKNNQFVLVDEIVILLALNGYLLDGQTKILDFGCGEGGLVYQFRNLGYNAYGFDMHNRVVLRDPGDEKFFRFLEAETSTDTSDQTFESKDFVIGYPDNTFDLVFSTSVLEHVQDHEAVLAEISRVTKETGISLHIYPPRYRYIEPHIYVPLGGRFQSYWYFYVFGLLGVRNEYQKHMTAKEVAANNVLYSRTGIKYPGRKVLLNICKRYFSVAKFITRHYYRTSRLWTVVLWLPGAAWIFEETQNCALLLKNKRRSP